ncbi:MAG: Na+/H+ antiporter NhaC family protein [Desulfobacterium sp.]
MNEKKTDQPLGLMESVAMVLIPIASIFLSIIILNIDTLMALLIGAATGVTIAIVLGFKWDDLMVGITKAVSRVTIVLIILYLVGILVAVWIKGGTIPYMFYWGLNLMGVKSFLAVSFILCSIFSLCTGTSFGTIAAGGVVLMGVGQTLGINPGMTAGAIISGAFLGDKMSPASDTTNFASSVVDVKLFSHIGSMMYTTIPAGILSLILFTVIGFNIADSELPQIVAQTAEILNNTFQFNIFLLIPPVLFITCSIKRVPAIPTMFISIVVGGIVGVIVQDGLSIHEIFNAGLNGSVYNTGTGVDGLLSRGGLNSMFFSITIIILAMSVGGIIESTGALKTIVDTVMVRVKSVPGLILSVMASNYLMLGGTGDMMMAISLTGRSFAKTFEERGISPRVLSRTLEDSATLGAPLFLWGVSPGFIQSQLGLNVMDYGIYCFLNYLSPIIAIICAITGFGIFKLSDIEKPSVAAIEQKRVELSKP